MTSIMLLRTDWKERLRILVSHAENEIIIASPYMSQEGTDFIRSGLSPKFRREGTLRILTNLSPINVCQGATDPRAVQSLTEASPHVEVVHLPRLHAKVYLGDCAHAVVTSANLTHGGLALNYEYGIDISDRRAAESVRGDIMAYSKLGAPVGTRQLDAYCQVSDRVQATYRKHQSAAFRSATDELRTALRSAEDALVCLRLAAGSMHAIFAKTILYLLKSRGQMTTETLHALIESIHPDLCDNTVDRVIDGRRFGKKWKHAVRTAQQHLKKKAAIRRIGTRWAVTPTGKSFGG